MYTWIFDSKIGPLTLQSADGESVRTLHFGRRTEEEGMLFRSDDLPPVMREACRQVLEYLDGKRRIFDVPLQPAGTPFQLKVWQALQSIPYGEVRTYGQIAAAIGCPKASRAVGMANHCNPLPLFIPCHRVIGSDGRLTGFAGGLEIKEKLLRLEGFLLC